MINLQQGRMPCHRKRQEKSFRKVKLHKKTNLQQQKKKDPANN